VTGLLAWIDSTVASAVTVSPMYTGPVKRQLWLMKTSLRHSRVEVASMNPACSTGLSPSRRQSFRLNPMSIV
jgi:hypothetical protein